MRWILRALVVLRAIYLGVLAVVVVAMHQPVDRFAKVMSKLPPQTMMVMPFEFFWLKARAGQLQAGDGAPDFNLATVDKKSQVRLSSFRGDRPVVLVFGSYT